MHIYYLFIYDNIFLQHHEHLSLFFIQEYNVIRIYQNFMILIFEMIDQIKAEIR
jgi:hypothetical protein